MRTIFALTILFSFNLLFSGEKAPQSIVDLAHSKLSAIGTDQIIADAVNEQNAKSISLAQIKKQDEEWKSTPGLADFMKEIMVSKCGKHLAEIQKSTSYFAEIFVMDNQGANVAMTDKTSDYWQGDEDKFTESYKNGKGAIHISEVEFDDSAQAYLVQVSVPVKDKGKVIGAITFGIDIDKVEK